MFLDDELIQFCRNAELNTPEAIQQLNIDVCKKCEDYYKGKLYKNATNNDVKVILNKIFNLFDSFVRMAKKDKNKTMNIIGDLFEKYTFKKQFLQNKEMDIIYKSL